MSEILHEFEKLEQETKERIRDRTLKINGARMKLESILMQLSEEEAAGADLEEEILSAKNELSTKIDACKEVEAGMKVKTEKLDSMDRELRTLYSSQVAEVSQVETQILRASSKILRSVISIFSCAI